MAARASPPCFAFFEISKNGSDLVARAEMSTSSEAASKAVARKRSLATYAVVLQLVGLLLSAQLLANHYTASHPAVCEMGRYVSCAAVQNSPWAFFLGVPLAFFGLVFFVIAFAMALYLAAPREDDADIAAAFAVFQGLGLLSVGYFVVGEVSMLSSPRL